MKKDWKYILYLSLAIGLFLVVKLTSPKQHNWRVTYMHVDMNPFGAYALNVLLPSIFNGQNIQHNYETLYEIKDSLKREGNILIISGDFHAGEEDTNALFKHLNVGGTALIAADYFSGHFRDTLQLSVRDHLFDEEGLRIFDQEDTSSVRMATVYADTSQRFYFKRENIPNYFSQFDTTRTTVLAVNEENKPVAIRMQWGKGNLILCTTPMAFTNIYLLAGNNNQYVSSLLSYLPQADIVWTEYYHLGRMEVSTPLRFILMNEPLRWAYYVAILSLLIFMIFEMKRKQRIIPIIKPLQNTTLEFVGTIGSLYFQHADHKNIADKKINFFLEHVRVRYWLSTAKLNDEFISSLSHKSGIDEKYVSQLVKMIVHIQSQKKISANELIKLDKQIHGFTTKHEYPNGIKP